MTSFYLNYTVICLAIDMTNLEVVSVMMICMGQWNTNLGLEITTNRREQLTNNFGELCQKLYVLH